MAKEREITTLKRELAALRTSSRDSMAAVSKSDLRTRTYTSDGMPIVCSCVRRLQASEINDLRVENDQLKHQVWNLMSAFAWRHPLLPDITILCLVDRWVAPGPRNGDVSERLRPGVGRVVDIR